MLLKFFFLLSFTEIYSTFFFLFYLFDRSTEPHQQQSGPSYPVSDIHESFQGYGGGVITGQHYGSKPMHGQLPMGNGQSFGGPMGSPSIPNPYPG